MLSKIINNIDTTNKQTTIDTSTAYQTIEGFGASAAWWAQYVGGWDNLDEIMELLYSKEKGAGLNIYRYNLGTGSQDDTHIADVDRRTAHTIGAGTLMLKKRLPLLKRLTRI